MPTSTPLRAGFSFQRGGNLVILLRLIRRPPMITIMSAGVLLLVSVIMVLIAYVEWCAFWISLPNID
jgi:hypothetical protein